MANGTGGEWPWAQLPQACDICSISVTSRRWQRPPGAALPSRVQGARDKLPEDKVRRIAMLRLLKLSSSARQLEAARAVLRHLAEVLDARFSVRLWDGSSVPLGRNVHPRLEVIIQGP